MFYWFSNCSNPKLFSNVSEPIPSFNCTNYSAIKDLKGIPKIPKCKFNFTFKSLIAKSSYLQQRANVV